VLPQFWQVVPRDFVRYLAHPLGETAEAMRA
jgi:hypothetical protein